ncbi:hypothetical protein D3C85_1311610 [compost metagenome]
MALRHFTLAIWGVASRTSHSMSSAVTPLSQLFSVCGPRILAWSASSWSNPPSAATGLVTESSQLKLSHIFVTAPAATLPAAPPPCL